MAKPYILVVEDDADIQQLVSYNLIKAGFHVGCADSGEEALASLERDEVDCILLDLMLPGMSGIEVCAAVRKSGLPHRAAVPILMLTAKGEEEDVVAGLEAGADDYITKPFSPKVLIARVKAVLRRGQAKEGEKEVTIYLEAVEVIDTDNEGKFTYNYNTAALPPGDFTVLVGDSDRTISLSAAI